MMKEPILKLIPCPRILHMHLLLPMTMATALCCFVNAKWSGLQPFAATAQMQTREYGHVHFLGYYL